MNSEIELSANFIWSNCFFFLVFLPFWTSRPSLCVCALLVSRAENYHGSNTVFLVGMLMSVVGGVFITFALMALCYRSVVVHKNFSLCLRLVSRKQTEGSFHTIFCIKCPYNVKVSLFIFLFDENKRWFFLYIF